jgi:hypothetical protein
LDDAAVPLGDQLRVGSLHRLLAGRDGRIWPHRDGCSGLHRSSVEEPDLVTASHQDGSHFAADL